MPPRRPPAILDAASPASPLSIPAAETAVLLVDYQNIHVQHLGPPAVEAVHKAQSLRRWADAHHIPVIIATTSASQTPLRHAKFHDRAMDLVRTLEAAPHLAAVHPALAQPEPEPEPEPAPEPTDEAPPPRGGEGTPYHVTRRLGLVSALSSEGLGAVLRGHATRSLVVGGISTSGCVLSTARDGAERGYVVSVVADACADPAPGLHEVLVGRVLPLTANVVSLEELLAAWPEG